MDRKGDAQPPLYRHLQMDDTVGQTTGEKHVNMATQADRNIRSAHSTPPPAQVPMARPLTQPLPRLKERYTIPAGLPHLAQFSTTPCYNTETVVTTTGVPTMTLRAWERHYSIPSSWHGEKPYGLYSARDIAAVHWLRQQIQAGCSPKQAIGILIQYEPEYTANTGDKMLLLDATSASKRELTELHEPLFHAFTHMDKHNVEQLMNEAFTHYPCGIVCHQLLQPVLMKIFILHQQGKLTLAVEMFMIHTVHAQIVHLIESGHSPKEAIQHLKTLIDQTRHAIVHTTQVEQQQCVTQVPEIPLQHEIPLLEEELLLAIQRLDKDGTQRILDEAFLFYGVEEVCIKLIQPILSQIKQLWKENKISVTIERFASNLIRTRLSHLFQATPNVRQGAPILVGCPPQETHEIGMLILALCWRKAGLNVFYLGQMIETDSLLQEMSTLSPAIVCLSATTHQRVKTLAEVAKTIAKLDPPRPIFCFGGQAFSQDPDLIYKVPGVFLGNDVHAATQKLKALLHSDVASRSSLQI